MAKKSGDLPGWFRPLLDSAKDKAGSRLALARKIGMSHPAIMEWEEGAVPGLDRFLELLEYVGGDISHALPGDPHPARGSEVKVWGEVSAGNALVSEQHPEYIDALTLNWQESRAWSRTTGPVAYLRVRGDSMEPAYPDRCLIACRAPQPMMTIPQGWPAILQDVTTHEQTFKLHYEVRGKGGRPVVLGVPINNRHELVSFSKGRPIVNYLVLGKVQPFMGDLPERGMILRDSG